MFKRIIETLFIALAYYLSGKLGQTMAIPPGNVTPVWPPSGIALALLLLMGSKRAIPGLFLGAFAVNLSFFNDAVTTTALIKAFGTGSGIAIGSVLQPLLGLYLIQRFVDNADPLHRIKNFLTFIAIIPLMCLISASVGTTCLTGGGFAPWAAYSDIWLTWWLGDSVGVLVAAPLLLAWANNWRFEITSRTVVETFAIFVGLVGTSWIAFGSEINASIAFLPVPVLLWAALRLDLRGTIVAVLTVETLAIWNTLQGLGPFQSEDINQSLLLIQLFIAVFSTTIMIVAIFVKERDLAQLRIAQEERFRIVFNTSRDAYFFQDENTFIDCNESTVRMLGYDDKSQIIGLSPKEVSPEFQLDGRSSEEKAREMIAFAQEKRFHQFEWTCIKRNGDILPLEVTLAPIILNNQPVIFSIAHDLTERKKAEQALYEGEEYRSAILESSLDCLISMDHEGKIIEFNPASEKVFGHKRDEVIGRTLSEIVVPPALREAHEKGLKHYLSTGEGPVLNQRIEISAVRADGTEFPIELTITPVSRGDTPVFTAFIRDITERKQAEEALAHLVEQQNASLEISRSVLRIHDQNDLEEVVRTCDEQLRKAGLVFRSLALHRIVDEETKNFDSYDLVDSTEFRRFNRPSENIYNMWQQGRPVYRETQNMIIEGTSIERHQALCIRHGYTIKSILDIGHARGTFALLSDREEAFTEENIRFLQNITDTISVGISRIEDLERIEARNAEMIAARDEAQHAAREAEAANRAIGLQVLNLKK